MIADTLERPLSDPASWSVVHGVREVRTMYRALGNSLVGLGWHRRPGLAVQLQPILSQVSMLVCGEVRFVFTDVNIQGFLDAGEYGIQKLFAMEDRFAPGELGEQAARIAGIDVFVD